MGNTKQELPGYTFYFKSWMAKDESSGKLFRYYSPNPGQDRNHASWETRNQIHAWCRANGYQPVFIGG